MAERPIFPSNDTAALRARRDRATALRRARLRARRRRLGSFVVLALVTVAAATWSFASATGNTKKAVVRTSLPHLVATIAPVGRYAGLIPPMPYPAKGEGAVALLGTGVVAASRAQREVPIASVTKMMTAYLVLKAYPLVGTEQGPSLHFTAADHTAWGRYLQSDLSNVELVAGESLTERQLLEALLIPSADNVADILARWVGGTEAKFVARMNATAAAFGMTRTHYADASGVSSHSLSTAADQALLATIVMRNPVFRSIVAIPDMPFPVEGRIWNYNPVLGVDGIVGVKTGFTPAAGSCMVAAAWRNVGGHSVLVVTAVTGQPLGLWQAATQALALLKAATPHLRLLTPFGPGVQVSKVKVPWLSKPVPASISGPLTLVGWGGLRLASVLVGSTVTRQNLSHGWAAGSVIGTLKVTSQFGPVLELPVTIGRAIPPPPAGSISVRLPVSLGVQG
ncbi:MAG: D-alanyl-D-alanine carboxypeptidase family protein [Acidimicrobiales bacterium]